MSVTVADAVDVRSLDRALERGRLNAERRLTRLEQAYERLIRLAGRNAAGTLSAQTLVAAANPDWQPPPEGTLVDADDLSTKAAERLAAEHERILEATAGRALDRIGIVWDVSHQLAQELLAQAGTRTGVALGAAVQPVLRATIAEAYTQGLSVIDAADLIRSRIGDAAPAQARMLARTDLNGLANGGSVMAAKIAGVGSKKWLTAGDERVRPDHMAANGQTVPIDQPFSVGGEQLAFPGDPAGSNAQVANCRCTVTYEDAPASRTAAALSEGGRNMDTMTAAAKPKTWRSDLTFEGQATGDGRYMMPGSVTWRDLPIPLMAMTETGPGGHEGAFLVGKITEIERDAKFDMDGVPLPHGVVAIRGHGIFDAEGANGAEIARLVGDEFVRGVSVDPGSVELGFRDPETGDLFTLREVTPELIEREMFGEIQQAYISYEISAATICPSPAFADARIAVTASGRKHRLWAPLAVEAHHGNVWDAAIGGRDYEMKILEDGMTHITVDGPVTLSAAAAREIADAGVVIVGSADNASALDDQIAASLRTLIEVSEIAARADFAEQERDALRRERDELRSLVTSQQEAHRRETDAEKQRTLAQIEAMTARFTERKPREVRVLRDDSGRAVGYQEVTA